MPVGKSLKAYKEEKLNCAQSILRGFQDKNQVRDEQITAARKLGGGRAEDGICGALHAALQLAENDEIRQSLHESFIVHASSSKCREIRRAGKISCAGCVELAAKTLHEKNGASS
ncbi:MAG: C-GCAxxG-C-C family (seleno)protein [Victivallaceae bacterium]